MLYLSEYAPILCFIILGAIISCLLFILSYVLSTSNSDVEKLSGYECGFSPFDDARTTFDVRFYLVGILFIIFDLEISFLFPWTIILGQLSWLSLFSMIIFLTLLTIGFLYEWKKGALNWD